MNESYEDIGSESLLPTELIDSLNTHRIMVNNQYAKLVTNINSLLDEHELAMTE